MDDDADFRSEVDPETWDEMAELAAGATHATGFLHAVTYWVGSPFARFWPLGSRSGEEDTDGGEETPLDFAPDEGAELDRARTEPGPGGGAWTSDQVKAWGAGPGGAALRKALQRAEAEQAKVEPRRSFTVRLLHPTLTLEQHFRLPPREPRPREQRARRPLSRRASGASAPRDGPRRSSDDDPPLLARLLRAVARRLRGRAR